MKDEHIFKRHNKTLLLYHFVFPLKYRRDAITTEVGESLKMICIEISERYDIHFLEIGYEPDHVHFLVQSISTLSVTSIVQKIKSLTARNLFLQHPEIKKKLWGGSFWTSGYYANTVGLYAGKEVIRKYIENQGKDKQVTSPQYKKVHDGQLKLFL